MATIHPVTRLKLFFTFSKPAQETGPANTVSKDRKFSTAEFQRKAHIGNYFAGPHCVFDPRLID